MSATSSVTVCGSAVGARLSPVGSDSVACPWSNEKPGPDRFWITMEIEKNSLRNFALPGMTMYWITGWPGSGTLAVGIATNPSPTENEQSVHATAPPPPPPPPPPPTNS